MLRMHSNSEESHTGAELRSGSPAWNVLCTKVLMDPTLTDDDLAETVRAGDGRLTISSELGGDGCVGHGSAFNRRNHSEIQPI